MKKLLFISLFTLLCWFFTVDSQAATYYFADDGTDNGCTDWENPCLTLSRAEAIVGAASSGDKILFAEGDTWVITARFEVDTAGVTIGAFNKSVSGAEITTDSANKPIFDAEDNYPTTKIALVHIQSNNCTVRNLDIRNGTSWDGITWDDDYTPGNPASNQDQYPLGGYGILVANSVSGATVQYNKVSSMWHGGIYTGSSVSSLLIDGNELTDNERWYKRANAGSTKPTAGWDGNISMAGCSDVGASANCTASNNLIYDSFGEGIGVGFSSYAENNTISDTSNASLYANGKDHTVFRNNLVVHTTDSTYRKSGQTHHGGGVVVGTESGYGSVTDSQIYNNILINGREGIRLKCADVALDDIKIYSNTLIDNDWNFRINNGNVIGQSTPVLYRNNISLCTNSSSCTHYQDSDTGPPAVGLTPDYNMWFGDDDQAGTFSYADDLPANFKGGNDVTSSPLFNTMSGYTAFTAYTDLVLPTDVTPGSAGGGGVDAGDTLGSPYNTDYAGTSRPYNSIYDIGAYEFTGALPQLQGVIPAGVIFN
jgi:hypothetical protein